MGADPSISGKTTYLQGQTYKALDGVDVTVMRKGSTGKSDTSKNGGMFGTDFPAGGPVKVLFYGPTGTVPQLQSLSAEAGVAHRVEVTLYTIAEAKERGVNVQLHIKSIVDQLAAEGITDETNEQVKKLKALLLNRADR
jgi:hypothetical protein